MKRSMKAGTMLYPLPAVLVTGGDMEHSTVMTAAWTGIVNSDPPMTYVSIRPERYSYDIIKEAGEFVINLTTADMAKEVDYAGCISGRKEDKFAKLGFVKEPCEIVKAPMIAQCPVSLECRVKQILELGSHDLFLADILAVRADERLIDERGRLKLETADLLAYVHGHYHRVADAIGHFGFSVRRKPGAETRVGGARS